jgi:glycyl-tRNA synthetase beta chain
MAKTFFFEILSEEIPARMQKAAVARAKDVLTNILTGENVKHGAVFTYCAPRRLCVCVQDTEEASAPCTLKKRGPRKGAPVDAVRKFLVANNVTESDLISDDEYNYAIVHVHSVNFVDKISKIAKAFSQQMPWPKSMCWTLADMSLSAPWVRPVRSVLCMWGGECVPFEMWGLTAANVTYYAEKPIVITSFEQYVTALEEYNVVVDYNARQKIVLAVCNEALQSRGAEIIPDPELLDEVTGLIDYPFAVVGKIDDEFMHLPAEVLRTSMRVHQKYFATADANGAIAPYFVAISNQPATETTLRGFENVLRARLSDALFFYNEDLKFPLIDSLPKLNSIIFHEKLGSLRQKVERLKRLVPDRSATLCKLDLVTNMVGEFNELQGIMGAHYALAQGESAEVAQAIVDHYKGHGDSLPQSALGAKLAVADKLDSLIGFFSVGIKPTSSKDPYALRRAALGIIRISTKCLQVDLEQMLHTSIASYSEFLSINEVDVYTSVVEFIYERFAVYLKEQEGIRYDIVQSVLANGASLDLKDLLIRCQAIQHYLSDDFMQLFIRVRGLWQDEASQKVNDQLIECAEEGRAFTEYENCAKANQLLIGEDCTHNEQYYSLQMQNIAAMKEAFDDMFSAVQINCENTAARNNRQALLSEVMHLYLQIADFSKIEIC